METPQTTPNSQIGYLKKENEQLKKEIELLKESSTDQQVSIEEKNQWIKTLYNELEKKNKELEKLDKLKSDFVASVSHGLRTPLAVTLEGLSIVLDSIPGPINEKQKNILLTARQNLEQLNQVIGDLLDISQIEAGQLDLRLGFVNVIKLFQNFINSYQPIAVSKDIKLSIQIPQDSLYLYIDRDKIIQVIENLLDNALKFTKKGGSIHVAMHMRKNDVLFTFTDTGIGIAKEDMPRLFNKFQQLARLEGVGLQGSGLGLTISKAVIELHGGEIWAESQLGKGTSFYFTLPTYDTVKATFENQFDSILKGALFIGKPVSFILLYLNSFGSQPTGNDETIVMHTMNTMISILNNIASHPEDKVFIYNMNSIYVILPETNKMDSMRLIGRIKDAIKRRKFVFEKKEIKTDFKYGLAVFPLDANDRAGLIKVAQENITRRKDILLVDDDNQIIQYFEGMLTKMGFGVRSAYDGEQCLKLVEQHPPDLIILDIIMPQMNGFEVYGRLQRNPKTTYIPVVMLTEHDVDLKDAELIGLDVSSVMHKQDGFDKLLGIVKSFL